MRTLAIAFAGIFACAMICATGAQSGTEKILHCFGGAGDGTDPVAGMTKVNSLLFGTTEYGGSGGCASDFGNGCGTVFSFDPATNTEKVVYSFQGGTSDGELPYSPLELVHGVLYGTTLMGGSSDLYCYNSFGSGCGTLYSLDPSTGKETVLHKFQGGGTDGIYPAAAPRVILTNGPSLFGTTAAGGTNTCNEVGCGTIYRLDLATGTETIVYSFSGGDDASNPTHALTHFRNLLYSTTTTGGMFGYGTVFSFDPETGAESVRHAFGKGSDGSAPYTAMTAMGDVLYGTTFNGGAAGVGTVFSFDPATDKEAVLYSFKSAGKGGDQPSTDLFGGKNRLYGTTAGPDGGVVYSFDPDTGAEVVYSSIGESNDPFENTGLVQRENVLYGVATQNQTCSFYGAIYSVTKRTGR